MLTIHKASRHDSESILELYAMYDREPDLPPEASRIDNIFAEFAKRNDGIYIAKNNAEIFGTFSLYICPDLNRSGRPFAVLENVIVSQYARRQGVGKHMVETAVSIAKQAGCHKIMLQSGNHRVENHLFYERCGFKNTKKGFVIQF